MQHSKRYMLLILVLAAGLLPVVARAAMVARFTGIVRQVEVSTAPQAKRASWGAAQLKQELGDGYGVRTRKRSLAEISFADRSVLRVNERTDLVVHQAAQLRRVELGAGAVWLRVAKGSNTSVVTPVCTATAKGTRYTVAVAPDFSTTVQVLEDTVEVRCATGVVLVNAGQMVNVDRAGQLGALTGTPAPPTPEPPAGFQTADWWNELTTGTTLAITPGSVIQEGLTTEQQQIDPRRVTIDHNSGDVVVEIPWELRDKGNAETPGGIIPQQNLRLLDRTQTSYPVLAAGVIASMALNGNDWQLVGPEFGGFAFGISGDDGALGARGQLRGYVGRTKYRLDANAVKLTGDSETNWQQRLDSVAYVEHPLSRNGLSFYAGRKQFFRGPIVEDILETQLLSDRFSCAGVRARRAGWDAEAAWLYDSDPQEHGAQPGALATLSHEVAGGSVWLNFLNVSSQGSGATLAFSVPVRRNVIDVYGEVGQDTDHATVQTYGLYFPVLYQATDIDLYLEYAQREGEGHATSVIFNREIAKQLDLRAYADIYSDDTSLGGGLIWHFGKKICDN